MSINFKNIEQLNYKKNQPSNNLKNKKEPDINPAKQRQIENLERQQNNIQKRIEQLKPISSFLRDVSLHIAQNNDPNDDPMELFRQIRPLLTKLNLSSSVDNSKTELVLGRTKDDNKLYKVVLRRGAQITEDELDRLKRQEKYFDSFKWTSKAIELYLWYPYKEPVEPGSNI